VNRITTLTLVNFHTFLPRRLITSTRDDRPPQCPVRGPGRVGQKAKYSLRAHIVRFAPESGLKSDIPGGPFRANFGSAAANTKPQRFCRYCIGGGDKLHYVRAYTCGLHGVRTVRPRKD
jgi:hypothetical protein